ncbi:putative E3 ubiquitin-protein ligase NRDP1 [Daphnia magna]|uniref:Putative E3 ubiquitin-protein ligase NRDP1 n=1 Tax=Daphnia magna TaxID=35525 RepID=A0A164S8E2_9CRUS|nr:putative E3 ubiquitin-protein ligase NRDP1 [Daphnia magna]
MGLEINRYKSKRGTVSSISKIRYQAPHFALHERISRQPTFPVGRQSIKPPQLRLVPRILYNLIYRLPSLVITLSMGT